MSLILQLQGKESREIVMSWAYWICLFVKLCFILLEMQSDRERESDLPPDLLLR